MIKNGKKRKAKWLTMIARGLLSILCGRHQHAPVMKIRVDHRVYHNYQLHEPSRQLEMENGGHYRNKDIFDDPSNDVAQIMKARGY